MKASQLPKIKELRTLYTELNRLTPWKDYKGKLAIIMDECTANEIPTHLIMMEKGVFDLTLKKSKLLEEYNTEYTEYEEVKPKRLSINQ